MSTTRTYRAYYATIINGHYTSGTVHAFATPTKRDQWVDANWPTREVLTANQAERIARAYGNVIAHGNARPPRSWAGERGWALDKIGDGLLSMTIGY